MTWYAQPSWRLVRQVLADAFVLAWTAGWWLVSRLVDGTIRVLAVPARETGRIAGDLRGQLAEAANRTAELPFLGDQVRQPFDAMSGTVDGLASSAAAQVVAIEQAATLVGAVLFAIPVAMIVLVWLPARLRFARRAAAARALADSPQGAELLALRALANRPLRELTAVDPDPMAAWRAGHPATIGRLADLELAASGVRPRGR